MAGKSSHPNTPSRLRKGGKSSIATAQRNPRERLFPGERNPLQRGVWRTETLLGEQTSKRVSSSRTRVAPGALWYSTRSGYDREASLASFGHRRFVTTAGILVTREGGWIRERIRIERTVAMNPADAMGTVAHVRACCCNELHFSTIE